MKKAFLKRKQTTMQGSSGRAPQKIEVLESFV